MTGRVRKFISHDDSVRIAAVVSTLEVYCYAGRHHPQYTDPKDPQIVITYVCNSFDFLGVTVRENGIYDPQSVFLDL